MNALSITKEDVDKLPIENCNTEIVVIENRLTAAIAVALLKNKKQLGFDTETRPSFRQGVENLNKVALVQLSTETKSFLFRLNKIGIYKPLFKLFSDEKIQKIGFSLSNDLLALKKESDFEPRGFIDIQQNAKEIGFESLSLQKIYAILFKKKLSKRQRLSNWEAEELTAAQKKYAALDAWSCLRIYKKISILYSNNG